MRIALIRHVRPDIALGTCYGRLDVDVAPDADPAGVVAGLADFRPARLHSSPTRHCARLAEMIAAAVACAPEFHDALQELDFGAWEGALWDDVPIDALDLWADNPRAFSAPGGETGASLLARSHLFAHTLLAAGEDAVVVSHGGPLKIIRSVLAGETVDLFAPTQAMGEIVWIDVQTA